MSNVSSYIERYLKDSEQVVGQMLEACGDQLNRIIRQVVDALREGGTVYFCGNGGSAADAQHMASELVGRFERDRSAIPAVALTTDTSLLTAVSNDFGYPHVFERQVEGLVEPGDVLVGISTSGTSDNVVRALMAARDQEATTVGFTGQSGGDLADLCDLVLTVPSDETPHIQEGHLMAGHILCGRIEEELSSD